MVQWKKRVYLQLISFLSFGVILHFHNDGRKGNHLTFPGSPRRLSALVAFIGPKSRILGCMGKQWEKHTQFYPRENGWLR